jgi:hypothetical protein
MLLKFAREDDIIIYINLNIGSVTNHSFGFSLSVWGAITITHYHNSKEFLASIGIYGQFPIILRMDLPLIKKGCSINNYDILGSS